MTYAQLRKEYSAAVVKVVGLEAEAKRLRRLGDVEARVKVIAELQAAMEERAKLGAWLKARNAQKQAIIQEKAKERRRTLPVGDARELMKKAQDLIYRLRGLVARFAGEDIMSSADRMVLAEMNDYVKNHISQPEVENVEDQRRAGAT